MSLFRVDPEKPFKGPHQGQPVAESGAPASRAKAGMIMVHGRGATAKSILMLADEFAQPDVRYLAPQADTHTWYPYSFLADIGKNQPGLSSGLQTIHDLIQQMVKEGISKDRIILLGFSQGACLALEYIARHPQKLGGMVGLSGGLIGPEVLAENYAGDLEKTPVFIGCGEHEPHVPAERIHLTAEIMNRLNGQVTKRIYPDTGHTVTEGEVKFVRGLLADIIHR